MSVKWSAFTAGGALAGTDQVVGLLAAGGNRRWLLSQVSTFVLAQAQPAANITGGSVTGITDLAVADGGTGASSAGSARNNLGAAASGANSDITSLTGLTTPLSAAQGGTGGTGGAWTTWTPTVTPGSGTFTSVEAGGRYTQIGKTVFFRARVTITTNGTAANFIDITLPIASNNVGSTDYQIATVRENGVTGLGGTATILNNSTTMRIVRYDNAYLGGTGAVLNISGTYEAA